MKKVFFCSVLIIFSFSCKKEEKKEKIVKPGVENKTSNKDKIKNPKDLKKGKIDYKKKIKEIVNYLNKKNYKKVISYLDKKLKKHLPEKKLKSTWEDIILKTSGVFKKIEKIKDHSKGKIKRFIVDLKFEKSIWKFKFSFNKTGSVDGFFASPEKKKFVYNSPSYADWKKFKEEKIKVGKGEWELPGMLSIPNGKGPFPLVILVHGSGPNDMDESFPNSPNKVFKDLAWGFATKGVAVLRYDKRTKVYPLKVVKKGKLTLMEETVNDVIIAFKQFETDKRFKNIFVLGHSLGGYASPLIGRDLPKLKGIISMAGSARSLALISMEQVNYLSTLAPKLTDDHKKQIKEIQRQVDFTMSDKLNAKTPKKDLPMGIGPAEYWLFLKSYKNMELAKTLKMPLFIINGERDYQVTVKGCFALWKKTLKDNKNVSFKTYAGLNHLFMKGEGKPNPQEYLKEGHVEKNVVEDIVGFILKNNK
jgi:dienelactone hydrolase